jgi:hypothetical protein
LGFSAPLLLLPIDATQIWRYNEAGEELGDAWYATGYDDSTWPSGPATLAFPAGEAIQAEYPVRTPMAGPVRQTTYFRTHFNLPTGPSTVTNLQLQVVLDDGGVFYLNGQELTRIRMPAGPVTTNTLTTAGSPSDPPQILETYTVPSTALRSGDNVLAVRVHQSSTTSSDTVLAAGLVAQVSECRQDIVLTITRNGNSVTVTSTGGTIYRATSITGPWVSAGPGPINAVASQPQEYFQVRP